MIRALRLAFHALTLALALTLAGGIARAQAPAATPKAAQTAPRPSTPQTQRLDAARASLDQIEKDLSGRDLTDADLQALRARLDPLAQTVQLSLTELQPRLDAAKARLDQLGPKPAAGAPAESPDISAERVEQQRQYDDADATMKRAKLLALQIEQDDAVVAARRREQFTRALFARSSSILNPQLWLSVARGIPDNFATAANLSGDLMDNARAQLGGWKWAALAGCLGGLAIFYLLIARIAYRFAARDPRAENPSALRKSIAAVWVATITATAPIVFAFAAIALLRAFDLLDDSAEPLVKALFQSVLGLSVTLGLARGLLASGLPQWRLPAIDDATAFRLYRLAIFIVAIVAASKILEACAEIVDASLNTTIALRGVLAVIVAVVLGLGLSNAAEPEAPIADADCLGPKLSENRDWRGLTRMAGWTAAITIGGAALLGYNAFGAFLVNQGVWIAFIGGAVYLLMHASREAIATWMRPQTALGRVFIASVGLPRSSLEQIAILISGAVHVGLLLIAAMLALAPWGIGSDDMFGNVSAAFFGFKVGDVTISLSGIIVAFIISGVFLGVTRALQNWLENSFLPHTQLDAGLRNSIRTSVGYIGFIVAAAVGLSYLGLGFDRLAIVAGALSVGIGFGLQSIVNNFVSGLILLWERAIRVGDWVVVGDEQGYVRRINVRSTEIETFDRAVMIVPNSNLVSGVVKNWVRNDRIGRLKNPVALGLDADPEKARAILLACASEQELVLKIPAPQVVLTAMDTALKFELICFISDIERSQRVKSDLNFEICKRFREGGLAFLPAAPAQIAVVGLEQLATALEHVTAR